MWSIRVQELFIYPIKSTQGIRVQEMELTELGPAYDRRWMLVGEKNEFLTQRKFPQLSQLFVEFDEEGLQLFTPSMRRIKVRVPSTKERIAVKIWQDVCQAVPADAEINQWISELLRFLSPWSTCRNQVSVKFTKVQTQGSPLLIPTHFI